jgi:hypothetical protein
MKEREIREKLETLVGARFSKEGLEKKLSQLFGEDVAVYEADPGLPDLDYLLVFSVFDLVDVDLYYLRDNAGNYYITETSFAHI